jgi:hypothetical protein
MCGCEVDRSARWDIDRDRLPRCEMIATCEIDRSVGCEIDRSTRCDIDRGNQSMSWR